MEEIQKLQERLESMETRISERMDDTESRLSRIVSWLEDTNRNLTRMVIEPEAFGQFIDASALGNDPLQDGVSEKAMLIPNAAAAMGLLETDATDEGNRHNIDWSNADPTPMEQRMTNVALDVGKQAAAICDALSEMDFDPPGDLVRITAHADLLREHWERGNEVDGPGMTTMSNKKDDKPERLFHSAN